MTDDTLLLWRYLDGELSAHEAHALRARLAENPELHQRLLEMRRVGSLVRLWAEHAEQQAGELVEPTLRRVQHVERQRARHATLGLALAAVLVGALPFASQAHFAHRRSQGPAEPGKVASSAAIERVEAGGQRAQVFVVGAQNTPVVWLADDAGSDAEAGLLEDPG